MRPVERIRPILKEVEFFWEKNPDLRFFQMIQLLVDRCWEAEDGDKRFDPFFWEEDKWLKLLEKVNEK